MTRKKWARLTAKKGGNTFCDGHFIKVTSLIDPFLDSDPSMNPDKGDFAIRVKLASRTNMDGVWVGFPDTGELHGDAAHPDELLLALDELEAESLDRVHRHGGGLLPAPTGKHPPPSMNPPPSSSAMPSTLVTSGASRDKENPDGWINLWRLWSWRIATAWITPWFSLKSPLLSLHAP